MHVMKALWIRDVNLSLEEDLPIILVDEHNLKIRFKGFHAYMMEWTPKHGEILKAGPKPKNVYDKHAVVVEICGYAVRHFYKGRSTRFTKNVSYFLGASNENCCQVEVTGKRVNLGDGEGLQTPCILHFSGKAKFVSKIKDILPQLM